MNVLEIHFAPMTLADYEPVVALWKVTPGLGFWQRAGWQRRDDIAMFTFFADSGKPRA